LIGKIIGKIGDIMGYPTLQSKTTPTDPWNIPQTLKYLFMKEISSNLYFWVPGVWSRGLLDLS